MIYHGHPRFTGDVDLFYHSSSDNCRRLYSALQEFWGGTVPVVESAQELTQPGLVVQFGRPPNRIDLLSQVDGTEFDQAWERREEALMVGASEEVPLPFLGLQDLIASKRAAGRPKDLDDLRYLERKL